MSARSAAKSSTLKTPPSRKSFSTMKTTRTKKTDSNCIQTAGGKFPPAVSFCSAGQSRVFRQTRKPFSSRAAFRRWLHDPLLLREDAFRRAGDTDGILCAFPRLRKDRTPSAATPGSYIWSLSIYPSRRTAAIFSMSCDEERMNGTAPLFKYDRIAVIPYILVRLRGEDGKTGAAQMQKQQ